MISRTIAETPNGRAILLLLILNLLLALITFFIISAGVTPLKLDANDVWRLLLANALALLVLGGLIARSIGNQWTILFAARGGSPLQKRVVRTFCFATAVPTIIVTIFSTMFFNFGIQAWFNEQIETAVEESLAVAESYLAEHRDNIRQDALALGDDIRPALGQAASNPVEFNRFVSAQAARRNLTEVLVFARERIIAQGRLTFTVAFSSLPLDALERAKNGEIVVLQPEKEDENKVRAISKVEGTQDVFVLVGRLIDERVIVHMEKTQGAVNAYRKLKAQLVRLQWSFSLVFVMLTFTLLLASLWYGLAFAARLTQPISNLAGAAERVRAGDYSGRVQEGKEPDEMTLLAQTFNRMTGQLETQRTELIHANRELDERRRFIEAVLGGVSAGVLALDANKNVELHNRSAAALLQPETENADLKGKAVSELIPGIHELLVQADGMSGEIVHSTLSVGTGVRAHTLHVRVSAEKNGGYIVTLDDITPLVAAQRNAAWSDVARRVAHEIKNPLTPIALSAERLRRKYLKLVGEDEAENYTRYLDTITRHVGDIGRMVEEFVSFARMPTAVMKEADIVQIIKKVLFSEQVAHPTIEYSLFLEKDVLVMKCDERQLSQALGNLMKNAAEAIEGEQVDALDKKGKISLSLTVEEERIIITLQDNGPGFPKDNISSVLEPYVTTRAKGTGLGLAIVKKIIEEHKGTMTLSNNEGGGARVRLSFMQHCDI